MNFEVNYTVGKDGSIEVIHNSINENTIETIAREVIDVYAQTKEAAIRQALINLGWTPPKEQNAN